ncbi:MAG: YqaA family protein [Pseudomonadota bacterium]
MAIFGALYDKVLKWSAHRHAERYLIGLSFAESSFFPIPPDVMLAPMCLARPERAWRLATVTTVASVLGGIAGYFLGYWALEFIEPLLIQWGYGDAYATVEQWFSKWGVATVLIAGFSPVPYKLFTVSAGAAAMNFPLFVLASVVGRSARFFLVAGLIRFGGPRYEATLRKHIDRIGWIVVALALLVVAWLTLRH